MDIERVHGDYSSTPLSFEFVMRQGNDLIEKEVFISPDANCRWELPTRDCWLAKWCHKLYFGLNGQMYKRSDADEKQRNAEKKQSKPNKKQRNANKKSNSDKKDDKLLNPVTELQGVEEFLSFLRENSASIVVFHGDDHQTIRAFLAKFGRQEEFERSCTMYNSQEFFREVEMGMQMRETRGPGQVLIRREDMNVKVG